MGFTEEKISGEYKYKGKVLKLRVDKVRLCSGDIATREVCDHSGGVAVLPLTDDGNVVCVRQFRYPYECELIEIPAGKLEEGEGHRECGKRELFEETGYFAEEFIYIGCIYPSPGYFNEKLHLYLARGLKSGEANLDEDEFLEVVVIPFDNLLEMVMSDEIHDAKTAIAVLKTKILLDKERGEGYGKDNSRN